MIEAQGGSQGGLKHSPHNKRVKPDHLLGEGTWELRRGKEGSLPLATYPFAIFCFYVCVIPFQKVLIHHV